MILVIFGFHTFVVLLMLTYRRATAAIERIVVGHPLVYIPENSQAVARRTGLRHGRIVGDYIYYDIRFNRDHYCGITFELRIPRRRLPYMKWETNDSDVVRFGSAEFHIDDNGLDIPGGLRCCSLRARINPKRVFGITEEITPATADCLPEVIERFNEVISSVFPGVDSFDFWRLIRMDYCLNIDLGELGLLEAENPMGKLVPVLPDDYIALIRLAKTPTSCRMDDRSRVAGNNAYLVNDSVHYNIYCKTDEVGDRDGELGAYSGRSVMRVEIQCMPKRMSSLKLRYGELAELASDSVCRNVVVSYWKRYVGMGDWYSVAEAKKIIRSKGFRQNHVDRLIWALERVARMCSVDAAVRGMNNKELAAFRRSVAELDKMGINIVTIPKERGLKHLRNPVRVVLDGGIGGWVNEDC